MDTFGTIPMVDLVSQVPTPIHNPPIHDPRVTRYCAQTGPEMKGSTRLVLRTIGDFVNPDTGKAHPSYKTIMFWSGLSQGAVSNAVKELGLLGVFQATPKGSKGNYEYHFVHMVNADFEPLARVDRGTDSLDHYRLRELVRLREEVDALRLLLVNPDTGEIPTVHNVNGNEEEEFSSRNHNYDSSSFPFVQEFDLDAPPADFNREYVRWAMREYGKWQAAWTGGEAAAFSTYGKDWPKFLEDLKRHRDQTVLGPEHIRCSTCRKVKPKQDSFKGNCGRCKHEVEHRNRQSVEASR